ncbi:MAG TPA: NADH:flavin oxidoreductase, partial [Blastocatellia bacterium]
RQKSQGHTKIFIQIIDFLRVNRRPEKEKYFDRFFTLTERHRNRLVEYTGDPKWRDADETEARDFLKAASDDALDQILDERELETLRFGYRERVTDMHLSHIRDLPRVLPRIFADAALRAREAGFDGVELHYAHAYTMASFLSAKNDRADGYGGKRENRVRLPLEVYGAVRERVGSDYVVGVRFLGDEVIEHGNRIEDAVYFGVEFARAGLDYLSVSKGGKFDDAKQPKVGQAVYPYTGHSGYECMPTVISDERGPFGRNVPLATMIKRAVNRSGYSTPVVTSGGIATFDQCEAILENGEADIIGAARQSLADPDWFLKMKLGCGSEIRRCSFTNYCEGLDQMHRQVTCKLWDRVDLNEPGITLTDSGKRRLIAPRWKMKR